MDDTITVHTCITFSSNGNGAYSIPTVRPTQLMHDCTDISCLERVVAKNMLLM